MATLPFFYVTDSVPSGRKNPKRRSRNADQANDIGRFIVNKRAPNDSEVRHAPYRLPAIPVAYGDRFIPRRYFHQHPRKIQSLNVLGCDDHRQIDIFTEKDRQFYWRSHNYRINLAMALNLSANTNLLHFHEPTSLDECNRQHNRNPLGHGVELQDHCLEEFDWECRPRLRPLAYNDSTHDMPGFNGYQHGDNVIDWNCQGQIAASFDSTLVVWGPAEGDDESVTLLYELRHIQALKYSPCGTKLALSINDVDRNRLQIWEVGNKISIYLSKNTSFQKLAPHESIRCIEWAKKGERIVFGLSTGTVHFVDFPVMQFSHHYTEHDARITDIRFSNNDKYLAIVDVDGNLSIIRAQSHTQIYVQPDANYIAWHPWRETHLLIGTRQPASIQLMDLKTMTIVASYRRNDMQYELCAMSMNQLSGELVVSFAHKVNGVERSDILVMASMNRIVDNISAHQGPVHFLLWDKSGTRIASAGQDESMNIWNFFGCSKRKEYELKRSLVKEKRPRKSRLDMGSMYLQFR